MAVASQTAGSHRRVAGDLDRRRRSGDLFERRRPVAQVAKVGPFTCEAVIPPLIGSPLFMPNSI